MKENNKKISVFFDQCYEEGLFMNFENEEMESALKLVEMFKIQKNWKIIEAGCGCGRLTRLIAEKVGSEGKIDACELSPRMAEHCKKLKLPECIKFHNKSVLDLDIEKGSIDCILCFNVWPHFPSPELFLKKFKEYLKPEGILYIAHSCSREFINSIHIQSGDGTVKNHILRPVEELSAYLKTHGWKTQEMIETENLYYLKAIWTIES
jgi:ubiquinone/menaquinone biosynthesis C-methylase UbiE